MPVETIRRLACDADIIPIVFSGAGVVLDVGRRRRLATADQRRALRARYRTCSIPDCTVVFEQCIIHHIQPFATGGRTDLHAMVPLCSRHHHAAHEGGWRLDLNPTTATLTVTLPDGTAQANAPPGRAA